MVTANQNHEVIFLHEQRNRYETETADLKEIYKKKSFDRNQRTFDNERIAWSYKDTKIVLGQECRKQIYNLSAR
jgi:hypothetical protein